MCATPYNESVVLPLRVRGRAHGTLPGTRVSYSNPTRSSRIHMPCVCPRQVRLPVGDWMYKPYGPYRGCMDGAREEVTPEHVTPVLRVTCRSNSAGRSIPTRMSIDRSWRECCRCAPSTASRHCSTYTPSVARRMGLTTPACRQSACSCARARRPAATLLAPPCAHQCWQCQARAFETQCVALSFETRACAASSGTQRSNRWASRRRK